MKNQNEFQKKLIFNKIKRKFNLNEKQKTILENEIQKQNFLKKEKTKEKKESGESIGFESLDEYELINQIKNTRLRSEKAEEYNSKVEIERLKLTGPMGKYMSQPSYIQRRDHYKAIKEKKGMSSGVIEEEVIGANQRSDRYTFIYLKL